MSTMIKPRSTVSFFKPPRVFGRRSVNGFPIGPRTERRAKENRQLAKLKITSCEIQVAGVCVRDRMLTWAHSRKSRFLLTSKDWQEAARCCLPCHQHIEALPHKEMHKLVVSAIKKRRHTFSTFETQKGASPA